MFSYIIIVWQIILIYGLYFLCQKRCRNLSKFTAGLLTASSIFFIHIFSFLSIIIFAGSLNDKLLVFLILYATLYYQCVIDGLMIPVIYRLLRQKS